MPGKPLRPCRHPGCCELVADGYCEAHRPKTVERSEEAKEWHRLYNRSDWPVLRGAQLLREPWCRECARQGIRTRATDVDHIVDHKGDLARFLDRDNLESLCHSCHSRKTRREMSQKSIAKKRA